MQINKTKVNFSKYKGKEVAIVKGKIVASGNSSKNAFEAAKKLFPKVASKDIVLLSVPKERFAIYILKK
ncbi:MAG: DUF5678 domain-containing protein [bacterium]|nr:DUF5678 domain-containing protein [bacterium]